MWKTTEGSTGRLIQLCLGYFVFYVITGVTVKYYRALGLGDLEFMVYSTAGGNLICLAVVLGARWYKLKSNRITQLGPLRFPSELYYIIPSGVCTAVVIPTTTLMYTLPISVMVAMVIMRGSVIVISRAVDAIQIKRGILQKKVYGEENWAVAFALLAVASNLLLNNAAGGFDFLSSAPAMIVLGSYVTAYFIRIYIMNYYKNTRPKGSSNDNTGFFGVEQLAAALTLALAAVIVYRAGGSPQFNLAFDAPKPEWLGATISGMAFGVVAFFSVFIFMYKGRTATFAGLVNRLTSLVAGTVSTLIFAFSFGGKYPKLEDWVSLGFILVAVAFLTRAEGRRAAELLAARELVPEPVSPLPVAVVGKA